MKLILDLSRYNKVTDWNKVKAQVAGVILRVGYRGYGSGKIVTDSKFKEYAAACKRLGIPLGLYFMSQAINVAEATEEATFTVNMAKQYGATLPLFIDSEDGDGTARVVRADGLNQRQRTDVAKAFCSTVEQMGYKAGVYASESWFNSRLFYNELVKYYIWVADYGKNTGVKVSTIALKKYDMHQYTSIATVAGVKGGCDMSECYVDFGIKGFEPVTETKTEEVYNMPTIKRGSKGKAVRIWQIIVGVDADGIFGDKTEAATYAFQQKAFPDDSKEWDCIVGKNSWKAGLESV